MIRWAILGTSFISEVLAKAINEAPNCELVAVGSRHLERAKQFANQYSASHYDTDYEKLIAHPDVDVVYIGLPNHLHKSWVLKCIAHHKHILCEKPFTVNARETSELIDALQKSDVFCMEAVMYRCHPVIEALIQIITSGILGKLIHIQASYSANIIAIANPTAGGALMSLGCYPISLVQLVAETAAQQSHYQPKITATGVIDSEHHVDSSCSLLLHYPDDLLANITVSIVTEMSSHFTVYGDQGKLEMPHNPWLPTHKTTLEVTHYSTQQTESIAVTSDLSLYATEVAHVNEQIQRGKREAKFPAMTLNDTLTIMRITDECRRQIGLTFDIEKATLTKTVN